MNDGLYPAIMGFSAITEAIHKTPIGDILLKDCHFCGLDGKPAYCVSSQDGMQMVFVRCYICEAQGPKQTSYELAKKWWNGDFKKDS